MATKVVYLHGFASGPTSRKAQLLSRRFVENGVAAVVPALDGGDFAHFTLGKALAVAEAAMGTEDCMLIGSSMGGYLAALLAEKHARQVRGVVLLAPAFALGNRWGHFMGDEQVAAWERAGQAEFYHYAANGPAKLWWEFLREARTYPEYPQVRQSALVFHGLADTVVPAAVSQEFARRTPQADLRLIDSDHELLDAVELVWQETWAFWKRLASM